ncbi:MAG: PH domain-containing protein [Actinobacteria bacterium]|nr:PH domain-containing protein [Actinomycetota bacterium]
MAYSRKLLNPDEQVHLDLHPHWVVFAKPTVLVILLAIADIRAQEIANASLKIGVDRVLLVALAAALGSLCFVGLKWYFTFFVVTSQRVIYREGVLARRGVEIPLDRVNNVNFAQSIIERMLGAGDLLIESASEDGQQLFSDIRKPEQVQNIIQEAIHVSGGSSSGYDSVVEQLERLEALLNRGSITIAEFEVQKQRLLQE